MPQHPRARASSSTAAPQYTGKHQQGDTVACHPQEEMPQHDALQDTCRDKER
jgi:hypothetical protein